MSNADLNAWADIIFKVGTPLMFAALFFLRKSFASQDQVQALNERINALDTAMKIMAEQNKVSERHQAALDDHETRIRHLERAA